MGVPRTTIPAHVAQTRSKEAVAAAPLPAGHLRLIGHGKPLASGIRQTMEEMFQADFSDVRVYEGFAAQAMGALAFTMGETLCFAPGLYDSTTRRGVELLGHELTHVVQQREGRVENPYGQGLAIVQDPKLEAEADRMGRWIADEMWSRARTATAQRHDGQPPRPHMAGSSTVHTATRSAPAPWDEVRGRVRLAAPPARSLIQRAATGVYDEKGVAVGIESSPEFRKLLTAHSLEISSSYMDPSDKISEPRDVPSLFVRRDYTFKVAGCLPDMLRVTPSSCHTIALIGHANAGIMCTGAGMAGGFDLDTLSSLEELLSIMTLRNVDSAATFLSSKLTTTAYGYRHVFLLGCSSSNDYDGKTIAYIDMSLAKRLAEKLKPAIVYGFDNEVVQIVQLHPLMHLDQIAAHAAATGTDGTRHTVPISCTKKDHKGDFLGKKTKMPQVSLDYFKYT